MLNGFTRESLKCTWKHLMCKPLLIQTAIVTFYFSIDLVSHDYWYFCHPYSL